MPAGSPGRVEVFDDRGARLGPIELPPNTRVIEFGPGGDEAAVADLARTDEVGLVWLERYLVVREEDRR